MLGAVALLAILYTALAGSAIEGLRSEGESRRRLEASLLADERLAEIELSLASGVVPPIGSAEEELERFRVVTEVQPLELPPRSEPEAAGAERASLAAKRAAARIADEHLPSLFAPPRSGTAPALLGIDVVVRWDDGIFEREVRRTTYALDATAVEAAFASAKALQAQRPLGTPGSGDGQGRTQRRARSRQGSKPAQPLPVEAGDEP